MRCVSIIVVVILLRVKDQYVVQPLNNIFQVQSFFDFQMKMVDGFVQSVLLSLCANYPPSNNTVTEPPPWKWGELKALKFSFLIRVLNQTERCNLKHRTSFTQKAFKRRIISEILKNPKMALAIVFLQRGNSENKNDILQPA